MIIQVWSAFKVAFIESGEISPDTSLSSASATEVPTQSPKSALSSSGKKFSGFAASVPSLANFKSIDVPTSSFKILSNVIVSLSSFPTISVLSMVSVIVLSSFIHLPSAEVPSILIVALPPPFNSSVKPAISLPERVIPIAVPVTAKYFPTRASSALPELPQAESDTINNNANTRLTTLFILKPFLSVKDVNEIIYSDISTSIVFLFVL